MQQQLPEIYLKDSQCMTLATVFPCLHSASYHLDMIVGILEYTLNCKDSGIHP